MLVAIRGIGGRHEWRCLANCLEERGGNLFAILGMREDDGEVERVTV